MNRLFHLSLAPNSSEQSERADAALVCSHLNRAIRVMVANPKGGAGKTPTALMLAGSIGHHRGGGTVYFDNNELRGDGALRSDDGGCSLTVRDLLDDARVDGQRKEDVDRYLRPQPSGHFRVLASAAGGHKSISRAEFLTVHDRLTRFYEVIVIDTGNHEEAENWLAAAVVADQLVVPTKWKKTHCIAADQMLTQLIETGHRDLVENAIVVGTNGPGDAEKDAGVYREHFARRVRAVIDLPTDPHLHTSAVRYSELAPATKRAHLRLAGLVFDLGRTQDARPSDPAAGAVSPAQQSIDVLGEDH